ncbi:MAG TPA: glucose-1-phosphate cytidylyltransferase [Bryobacteraceae bacterium]|jgi:glucose-1-phosphate cytidylyltransferase|nr:glucose-1-phosphate cytidylyltransferase [Bryobacteraceae bacterium]
MKVVILCGGQGTRLREETEFRPKPMVEIGGRPILWHIMKHYAWHGFHDFVLCLGYRGNIIREYFLNYEAMNRDFTINLGRRDIEYHGTHQEQDFSVTLAETGEETMTGGRLKRVSGHLNDDLFLLTYGDGLSDVNLNKLVEFHRAHGKLATVTVVRPVSRFGVVHIDGSSHVESFAEKPQAEGWVSAGFFVFDRKVLDYLGGDDCFLEREPLERLAKDNQLMAFHHGGFFQAMDTYREYKQLNEIWSSGQAPWKNLVEEPAALASDLSRLNAELKQSERVEERILNLRT